MPASSGPGSSGRSVQALSKHSGVRMSFTVPQWENIKSDTWHLLLSLDVLSTNKIYHLYIYLGSQRQSTAAHPERWRCRCRSSSHSRCPESTVTHLLLAGEGGGRRWRSLPAAPVGMTHAAQGLFLHMQLLPSVSVHRCTPPGGFHTAGCLLEQRMCILQSRVPAYFEILNMKVQSE